MKYLRMTKSQLVERLRALESDPALSDAASDGAAILRELGDLKSALLSRRDAFARCLAEKMLTYALGRGLDRADRRVVEQIVATLARNQYRFSALILAVVESGPFLNP